MKRKYLMREVYEILQNLTISELLGLHSVQIYSMKLRNFVLEFGHTGLI